MQVVLLLAGKNSRFYPFHTSHKAMAYLYGKPLLEYVVRDFKECGITDFVFVTRLDGQDVKDHFGDGLDLDISISYAVQEKPTGGGDALLAAKNLIKEDFIIPNPYHILEKDLFQKIIRFYNENACDGVIPGIQEKNIQEYGSFILEGNRITGIVEKPKPGEEPSNYRATSAYVLKPDFISYLKKEESHEYSYEDAITAYAHDKKVLMYEIDEKTDIPSLKYPWYLLNMWDQLSQTMKGHISQSAEIDKTAVIEDTVYVDDGAKIFGHAHIKGHTYIGKHAVVGDFSLIRDSNLAENTQVGVHSDITRSIIMHGAHSHGSGFIGDSVIGKDCRLGANFITANKRSDRADIRSKVKEDLVSTEVNTLGAFLGEGVKAAINVSTMPGVMIGNKSHIWPGAIVYRNIPENGRLKYMQEQKVEA